MTSRLRNTPQYLPFNTSPLTRTSLNLTTTFELDFFTDFNLVNPVLTINNRYHGDDKGRTFNVDSTATFILTNNLIFRSESDFDITCGDLSTLTGVLAHHPANCCWRLPEPDVRHHHDGHNDDQ